VDAANFFTAASNDLIASGEEDILVPTGDSRTIALEGQFTTVIASTTLNLRG